MTYDLIIRRGTIADGSGMPAFTGDDAIEDGGIIEVGRFGGMEKRKIEAKRFINPPGFISNHTHHDTQVLWAPLCTILCTPAH